jgi:glutaredoxin
MDVRYFVNGKLVADEAAFSADGPTTPAKSSRQVDDNTPPKEATGGAKTLEDLKTAHRFLALSLSNCPQCEELAAALASRGVPTADVFVKWDKASPEYPSLKAALSVFAGEAFTFPQVFVDGVYQGGFHKVHEKLEAGTYDEVLQDLFEIKPATVQRWINGRPMIVFSLPQCPQCDELKGLLEVRGVPVEKIFMKLDKAWPQYQSLKAQIIQLTGLQSFSFPQTFLHSEHQGSFQEVADKLASGHFDNFFLETFGIAPPVQEKETSQSIPAASISFDDDF